MEQPTTIGIDLAKTVCQAQGIDTSGTAILERKIRRGQVLGFFAGLGLTPQPHSSGGNETVRRVTPKASLRHDVR